MSRFQPYYSSYQPHDSLFADDVLAVRVAVFLATHAGRGADRICMSVNAGRLTLRGSASTRSQKELIESCSRRVAGVLSIISEITVSQNSFVHTPQLSHSKHRHKIVDEGICHVPRRWRFATVGVRFNSLVRD
jgi:hypothetical protein